MNGFEIRRDQMIDHTNDRNILICPLIRQGLVSCAVRLCSRAPAGRVQAARCESSTPAEVLAESGNTGKDFYDGQAAFCEVKPLHFWMVLATFSPC